MAGNLNKNRQDALALLASLRNDWDRVVNARAADRSDIHAHMRYCLEELIGLVREIEAEDA